ncbi:D-arabinono-1,4-lactone oxidase [Nocardioides sp. TF02-7]|uniref:D-arabinono-1,4-lactone oxidase n=1 Tax=Nocardioides sp. TF02-7 TaxID=2917724 RepID=UPI0023D9912D|nr:D-arabinono-1,4-lactone oxidase [Nocardioides sp. TF02-7]
MPRANRVAARLLGPRTYTDVAHRVFTTERRVVFREMEYAVPREVGLDALREARRALEASRLAISFPVEIRVAPPDDVPLSTGYGRASLYLAFHTHRRAAHRAYFALMEAVMKDHGGRPHWGKLHTRDAGELAGLYPRFGDFLALRDRFDPRPGPCQRPPPAGPRPVIRVDLSARRARNPIGPSRGRRLGPPENGRTEHGAPRAGGSQPRRATPAAGRRPGLGAHARHHPGAPRRPPW